MKHERIIEEDITEEDDPRIISAGVLCLLTAIFGAVFFILCFFFTFGVNKSDAIGNIWMHYAWIWIPILGIIGFSILFWLAKRWSVI